MIPPPVRTEILRRLHAAEQEHGVRVLLAVESGSRAWGFASPNSDYDARFIYAHEKDWYFSVGFEDQRDVIEYLIVDEIDLNGWDVRKALRLFSKSNPGFVEWIQSPIVYAEHTTFASRVRTLLPDVYSCINGIHHYRSAAKRTYLDFLRADLVPLKKYFYVLRPLLAVRWIEHHETPAPMEFQKMLPLIEGDRSLVADIEALLERKRSAPEMGLEAPVKSIDAFIAAELDRLENIAPATGHRADVMSRLDEVLHAAVHEAWT